MRNGGFDSFPRDGNADTHLRGGEMMRFDKIAEDG